MMNKTANVIVYEINILILLSFFFTFYYNKCEEIKQNNILTILKVSAFSNSFLKLKEFSI